MKRLYLAVFGLPKPHPEHAKIVDVIRAASGGEFTRFVQPPGVWFCYESETPPWLLDFGKILHTGDTRMIVEIGDRLALVGYGAMEGWLNARRPRRD